MCPPLRFRGDRIQRTCGYNVSGARSPNVTRKLRKNVKFAESYSFRTRSNRIRCDWETEPIPFWHAPARGVAPARVLIGLARRRHSEANGLNYGVCCGAAASPPSCRGGRALEQRNAPRSRELLQVNGKKQHRADCLVRLQAVSASNWTPCRNPAQLDARRLDGY